jgi:hypothetical protein
MVVVIAEGIVDLRKSQVGVDLFLNELRRIAALVPIDDDPYRDAGVADDGIPSADAFHTHNVLVACLDLTPAHGKSPSCLQLSRDARFCQPLTVREIAEEEMVLKD